MKVNPLILFLDPGEQLVWPCCQSRPCLSTTTLHRLSSELIQLRRSTWHLVCVHHHKSNRYQPTIFRPLTLKKISRLPGDSRHHNSLSSWKHLAFYRPTTTVVIIDWGRIPSSMASTRRPVPTHIRQAFAALELYVQPRRENRHPRPPVSSYEELSLGKIHFPAAPNYRERLQVRGVF